MDPGVDGEGLSGDHNHYSQDERALATDLDDPERFWRRAMDEVDDLPVADVKPAGFFERSVRTGQLTQHADHADAADNQQHGTQHLKEHRRFCPQHPIVHFQANDVTDRSTRQEP